MNRMVLAVDWDAQRMRIVHAALRRSGVRIELMRSVDVPPDVDLSDAQAVGGLLREVLARLQIRTRRVLLDVPRDQALLTTLNLPMASADEMPAMVEFQIAKELPFPIAEAVADFAMPESAGPDGRVDVLVGTVRREVVGYYERVCAVAGLTLERLGLRPYANKVAVNELLGREYPGCVMMVDVGPRLTEIDVISDGRLAFSRAASVVVGPLAPLGPDESDAGDGEGVESGAAESGGVGSSIIRFPQAGEGGDPIDRVVNALMVEVTRSFEAFRAQATEHSLERIVVGGDVGVEARLAEALGRRMHTPVELYNPAGHFGWPEEHGREARAFAAPLGLTCGHADPGRLHFDFLNPKKAVTVTERRLRKAPAVAVVVALFTVAIVGFYVTTISPKKQTLANLRADIDKLKKSTKELEEYQERVIAPIEKFESEQIVWVDELTRMATLLPSNEDAVLDRLDMYQRGAHIRIPLDCKQREIALEAVARIDGFRLADNDEQYFDAAAKTFTTKTGQYPSSGSIEVEIKGASAKGTAGG